MRAVLTVEGTPSAGAQRSGEREQREQVGVQVLHVAAPEESCRREETPHPAGYAVRGKGRPAERRAGGVRVRCERAGLPAAIVQRCW